METKHTPGPWSISKVGNNYDQHIIYSEKETIVNTVYGEANARLIASAPDLLESLQSFVDYLDSDLSEAEQILKNKALQVIKNATE